MIQPGEVLIVYVYTTKQLIPVLVIGVGSSKLNYWVTLFIDGILYDKVELQAVKDNLAFIEIMGLQNEADELYERVTGTRRPGHINHVSDEESLSGYWSREC
jgi:hypothetical protein